MKDKKIKFADKAKTILEKPKVSGVGDFLDNEKLEIRETVNTEIQESGDTENRITVKEKIREEFKLPFDLAEQLRAYAFENRITKTAVVISALEKFLQK
jgi:hypothetical protein